MRTGSALLLALIFCSCGSTRKQFERAQHYEASNMLTEAYDAYEAIHDRKPKQVEAHVGMKRTAQTLLDQRLLEASERYAANDLEQGDRSRNEAIHWKQAMDRNGLSLQWDGHVDQQRKSAQVVKAQALYEEANEAFREDRFGTAEELANTSLKMNPDLKQAEYLSLIAQLEPRYRQGRRAEELQLWREAFRAYRWVTDRDVDYKDAWQRLAISKEKAAYTLAYVPLFNEMLYTVQLGGAPGQVEEQLSGTLKVALLDLKDPLIMLVDRDNTHEILDEQQRNMQGTYDDRYVAEAGKLLGARYVLTGRVLRFDDILQKQIEVQIQMIDAETGRILLADVIRVNKQEIGKGAPRAQLLERASKRIAMRIEAFDPSGH